jgi:hypothetical protein
MGALVKARGLATDLVGALVEPAALDGEGAPYCPPWPATFRPSFDGRHTARVRAVWTEDGQVMALLVDPHGHMAEAFLRNVKVCD